MDKKAHLIGVGSPLVDLLAHIPDAFLAEIGGLKGGTEMVDAATQDVFRSKLTECPARAPGGSAANTIVGATRLGLKTGMLCKVGNDDDAAFYRDCMRRAGIDTASFKVNPQEPTGTCLSLITPDGQRTMRTYLGAAATLAPEDIDSSDFADFQHVHAEGYLLFNKDLMLHILKCAKQAGCTVSLDLSAPEVIMATGIPALREILEEYIDIVFANEDEAEAFSGTPDEHAGLLALGSCCPLAVVKLGARGVSILKDGEETFVESQPVKPEDTTGAGDLWAAGFLSGVLTGQDLTASARRGAALGAHVVQQIGAWIEDDDWKKLRADLDID